MSPFLAQSDPAEASLTQARAESRGSSSRLPSAAPTPHPYFPPEDAEWADPRYRRPERAPRHDNPGTTRSPRSAETPAPLPPASAPKPDANTVSVRGVRRLIPFNPSPEQLHQVLDDIVSPYASLDDVASNNGTTVLALSAWLALSETQAMLDQIEQAAYRRARVSAACNLTDAVNSLSFTLRAHVSAESNEPLGRTTDALNIRQRQRTDARKASWLLFRIARAYPAMPIDPGTLRFINTLKRERDEQRERGSNEQGQRERGEPCERESDYLRVREHPDQREPAQERDTLSSSALRAALDAPHSTASSSESPTISEPRASARAVEDRNANVSERAPSFPSSDSSSSSGSSLSSQPVQWGAAGALQDLPLAAGLTPDANSSRAPLVPAEHAPACETEPVPQGAQSPDPTPLRVESISPTHPSPCPSVALRGESASSHSSSSHSSPCLGASVVKPSSSVAPSPSRAPP